MQLKSKLWVSTFILVPFFLLLNPHERETRKCGRNIYISLCIPALLCHGMWTTSPGSTRLIVSDPGDQFYCLDYREKDGVVEGSFMKGVCAYSSLINISSTGPCILPLTAGDISLAHTLSLSVALLVAILSVTAVNLRRWTHRLLSILCYCGLLNKVKLNRA